MQLAVIFDSLWLHDILSLRVQIQNEQNIALLHPRNPVEIEHDDLRGRIIHHEQLFQP